MRDFDDNELLGRDGELPGLIESSGYWPVANTLSPRLRSATALWRRSHRPHRAGRRVRFILALPDEMPKSRSER